MNKNLLKTLSVITAFAYTALFLAVFIHGIHMMHMKGMMTDCPFMSTSAAVCDMGARDHLQYVSGVLLKKGSGLLGLLAITTWIFIAFLLLFKTSNVTKTKSYLFFKNQKYRFTFSLFKELFSCGILNPKAP
jgi:hypothetical protein